jgi:hypothetical protein
MLSSQGVYEHDVLDGGLDVPMPVVQKTMDARKFRTKVVDLPEKRRCDE